MIKFQGMAKPGKLKTFLHILYIGSASSKDSAGQIPSVTAALEFIQNRPNKQCYFYFIDPMHFYRADDMKLLYQLMDAGVLMSIIPHQFEWDKFWTQFKVLDGDELLLVDCAPVMKNEKEWFSVWGKHDKWLFCCLTDPTKNIDLETIYVRAISHKDCKEYKLGDDGPVPKRLTKAQKLALMDEVNKLVSYARNLPLDENDRMPPQWLRDQRPEIGTEIQGWIALRERSDETLYKFFKANNVEMYDYENREWIGIAKRIIG